jgi:hypothetical protein
MRARTLSRDPLELKSARDSSGEDFVFVPFVAKKSGPAISRGVVVSAGPAGFGHYVNWRVPWGENLRPRSASETMAVRFLMYP